MLLPCKPMSNAERQRRFRAAHPGYNRKYNGHPTAAQRRKIKQMLLEMHVQTYAAEAARIHMEQVLAATLCKPFPLMLPAPVEAIVLPGLNTIESIPAIASAPSSRAA